MRVKHLVSTGLSLAIGATAYAGVKTFNIGFGAPSVKGQDNVIDPERGAIFLDTDVTPPVFKGNRGTPTTPDWTPLSATNPTSLPSGAVVMTAATTCPEGTLPTDGASLLVSEHRNLFDAIATTYGSVDAAHFNVPNTAGVFVRGAGSQTISSISYSGTQGTTQGDQLQNITGTFDAAPNIAAFSSNPSGAFNVSASPYVGLSGTVPNGSSIRISFNAANSSGARTGTETRPANIVLRYCIVD